MQTTLRQYIRSVIVEMSQEDVATSKDPLDWITAAYQDPEEWGAEDEFQAMIVAADKMNLALVGEGSSRIVFDLKNNRVVKLASNNKGIEQNKLEVTAGKDPHVEKILASVHDYADDFSWVVADKVQPLEEDDGSIAESIIGIPWNDVRDLVGVSRGEEYEATAARAGQATKSKVASGKGRGCLTGESFLSYIDDFLTRYQDMLPGDLAKLSSWGVSQKGCLVLLDYGITRKKFREMYR